MGLPICVNSPHPNIIVCYSSGQPRSESTVPGMVHACRRQALPRRASGLKQQMERNEAFLSLSDRAGIKCWRLRGGSMASLQPHQEECYTFGFELQTGVLHSSPACCSSTERRASLWTGLLQAGFPCTMPQLYCTGCTGAKGCNPPDLFQAP